MVDTLTALRGYAATLLDEQGLDAITLQICDRTDPQLPAVQLLDLGVPAEASTSYRFDRIYAQDPFTDIDVNEAPDTADSDAAIARGDDRIQRQRSRCGRYWTFLADHDLEVEAVSTRRLRRGVYLSAGFLRRASSRHDRPASLAGLSAAAPIILNAMAAEVLRVTVQSGAGMLGLQRILDGPKRADRHISCLSERELQIAGLVSNGFQTKQVAHRLGLSGRTVENHLRNVYAKLGVHNRTSLAQLLS